LQLFPYYAQHNRLKPTVNTLCIHDVKFDELQVWSCAFCLPIGCHYTPIVSHVIFNLVRETKFSRGHLENNAV